MDVGSVQQVVALPISVAALAVSTVMALRQYRITRSTSHDTNNRTLMTLNAEFRTDAFQRSLDYVLNLLAVEFPGDRGISDLPLEARIHVYRVGHHYGDYGILAVLPTANRDQVLSYVHGRALEAWEKLQPYLAQERSTGCCDTYWSYFENLAYLATRNDKPRILDRLGLRRFDGTRWGVGNGGRMIAGSSGAGPQSG